jgi:hypothetical protein
MSVVDCNDRSTDLEVLPEMAKLTHHRLRLVFALAAAVVAATALVSAGYAGLRALDLGPAAASQYPKKKVTICHRTHSKKHPWVKIRVSSRALKAHMRHGDFVVDDAHPCPPANTAAKAKHNHKNKNKQKGKSKSKHQGKGKKHQGQSAGKNSGAQAAKHQGGRGKGQGGNGNGTGKTGRAGGQGSGGHGNGNGGHGKK